MYIIAVPQDQFVQDTILVVEDLSPHLTNLTPYVSLSNSLSFEACSRSRVSTVQAICGKVSASVSIHAYTCIIHMYIYVCILCVTVCMRGHNNRCYIDLL